MVKKSNREEDIVSQVRKVLREPLPANGQPHVIVIVYDAKGWHVNKAAPKGKAG
jgi:hypothetical protein